MALNNVWQGVAILPPIKAIALRFSAVNIFCIPVFVPSEKERNEMIKSIDFTFHSKSKTQVPTLIDEELGNSGEGKTNSFVSFKYHGFYAIHNKFGNMLLPKYESALFDSVENGLFFSLFLFLWNINLVS